MTSDDKLAHSEIVRTVDETTLQVKQLNWPGWLVGYLKDPGVSINVQTLFRPHPADVILLVTRFGGLKPSDYRSNTLPVLFWAVTALRD